MPAQPASATAATIAVQQRPDAACGLRQAAAGQRDGDGDGDRGLAAAGWGLRQAPRGRASHRHGSLDRMRKAMSLAMSPGLWLRRSHVAPMRGATLAPRPAHGNTEKTNGLDEIVQAVGLTGRPWQARTADQRIKSPLLYQLS